MSAALPFKLVSADSHIVEPPDLWTRHIDRRFLDRAPRFIRGGADGGDGFVCEGLLRGQTAGVGLVATKRKYANPEVYDFGGPGRWEEVPEASWDPDERIRELDREGIEEVLRERLGVDTVIWLGQGLIEDLDTDGITAKLRDGVLRVEIPKSARMQPKKIQVRME